MKQVQPVDAEKEFLQRVENEIGDNAKYRELHGFHKHLREETELGSGTIIGYLRSMTQIIDENGDVRDEAGKCSALKKYRDYIEETTEGGESQ